MRPVQAIRANDDIATDPFRERPDGLLRIHRQVLGGTFEFASESPQLMRLVRWAYDGLPRHRLSAPPARMAVRLVLGGRAASKRGRRA